MEEKKPQIRNMKGLFEHIKTLHSFKSDRECWEELEMSKTFFQEVKAGRRNISNEAALRIASKASLPSDAVLVFIQREKAHSDEERAIWHHLLATITMQRRIMDIM